MNAMRRGLFCVVSLGLTVLPVAAVEPVRQAQAIKLMPGWNATYIEVAPNETADEIFGAWPVDWVAAYDPAAFLETKQYSGTSSTEGTREAGFIMWRRAEGPLSPLKGVAANWVYVCCWTNAASSTETFTTNLVGRPAAPRITWHPSSTNEAMNYVGFSLVEGATTTLEKYFDGLDIGNTTYQTFYRLYGVNPSLPSIVPANGATEFKGGEVVLMPAEKVSDWSGVLNVSPMAGFDFSTNTTYQVLTVRNDGATARTVTVELGTGSAPSVGELPPVPQGLTIRDSAVYTNDWRDCSPSAPFEKRLAAGETLKLMMAVDRTKVEGPAGTYYGGLLTIRDADGGSNMRVTLPIEVTSDGGASGEFAWPKGLWLVSGALDTVTYFDGAGNRDEKAGGTMNVRLLLAVERDGSMKLLQRVVFGTDTNGVTHVYSPAKEDVFPVAIGNVKRISSAVLPIDAPVITTTNGVFGASAYFDFTVSENSRVNPFRHNFHPSHDGLTWDFETATPSGDDISNYTSTVKPELFSVGNRIEMHWDGTAGTAWNPDETLGGTLAWHLTGLRHAVGKSDAGTISMQGRFSMKRISSATLDK